MFAVIRTGGKQYKVAKNDVIKVEHLAGAAGEIVELDEVLMLGDGGSVTVGAPLVAGACVGAAVLEQALGDKVLIFKKKRRHNYRRKNGHRQELTVLRITEILTDGKKPDRTPIAIAAPKATSATADRAEKKAKPKGAAKKTAAKKPAAGAAKKAAAKSAKPKAAAKAAKPKAAKSKKSKE